MHTISLSPRHAALILPCTPSGAEEAEHIVRYALRKAHIAPWAGMNIDIFPGQGETLLLARPGPEVKISLAPAALYALERFFNA